MFHFVGQSARDFLTPVQRKKSNGSLPLDDRRHLDAAVTYLLRTIEAHGGTGSSKGYKVLKGWMPPYPETSGYIIPTLYKLSDTRGDRHYEDLAENIGRWLVSIQRNDGGFAGREYGVMDKPIVFDTGMILFGLNALSERLKEESFESSARRAGEFLLSSMGDDGCFVRNLSNDIVHTYNVRAAWALYQLGKREGSAEFKDAALRNADWTLGQQLDNGYFRNNIFKPGGTANTHGLGYILRGLLEIYRLSGEERFLEAVRRTADHLCETYETYGWLAANFDEDWNYISRHVCLTGCVQLAIVLLRLYRNDGRNAYRATAFQLIDDVSIRQNVSAVNSKHYGAIKGSHPIYGAYAPLQYPNWATKFFIDALVEKQKVLQSP